MFCPDSFTQTNLIDNFDQNNAIIATRSENYLHRDKPVPTLGIQPRIITNVKRTFSMSAESPSNPYQTPLPSDRQPASDPLPQARTVPASNGLQWVKSAWWLFKRSPWALIGCWILWMFLSMGIGAIIPFISTVFTPALLAGFAYCIYRLEQTGNLDIADLFEGFKNGFVPLLILGGLMLLAMAGVVIVIALMAAVMFSAMDAGHMSITLSLILVCLLVGLALLLFILFAMYWAPCLVYFDKQPPVQAIQLSIKGMTNNIASCLVYSLVLLLLNLAVLLTAGLAIIVVSPLIMISAYTSYRDIFLRDEPPTYEA